MNKQKFLEWKKQMDARPVTCYATVTSEGFSHFYETEEAAQLEIEWEKRRGKRYITGIAPIRAHSLALARERWENQWK